MRLKWNFKWKLMNSPRYMRFYWGKVQHKRLLINGIRISCKSIQRRNRPFVESRVLGAWWAVHIRRNLGTPISTKFVLFIYSLVPWRIPFSLVSSCAVQAMLLVYHQMGICQPTYTNYTGWRSMLYPFTIAPHSVVMLAMVSLSSIERFAIPSPENSIAWFKTSS